MARSPRASRARSRARRAAATFVHALFALRRVLHPRQRALSRDTPHRPIWRRTSSAYWDWRAMVSWASPSFPTDAIEIVVHLGARPRAVGETSRQPEVMVVGQMTCALRVHQTAGLHAVGVRFTPAGARHWLGAPLDECTDRIHDFEGIASRTGLRAPCGSASRRQPASVGGRARVGLAPLAHDALGISARGPTGSRAGHGRSRASARRIAGRFGRPRGSTARASVPRGRRPEPEGISQDGPAPASPPASARGPFAGRRGGGLRLRRSSPPGSRVPARGRRART